MRKDFQRCNLGYAHGRVKRQDLIYFVKLSFKSISLEVHPGHAFRHIDQASSGNSKLQYDVPGKKWETSVCLEWNGVGVVHPLHLNVIIDITDHK